MTCNTDTNEHDRHQRTVGTHNWCHALLYISFLFEVCILIFTEVRHFYYLTFVFRGFVVCF